jgi:hypothetical protein
LEKKKQTNFKSTIRDIKLFLDDIEGIMSVMKSNGMDVEISDSENKYDSIQDLITHKGENPVEIILEGKQQGSSFGQCSVFLKGYALILIEGSSNFISCGYELENLLNKKKRKWYQPVFDALHAKVSFLGLMIFLCVYWYCLEYHDATFSDIWVASLSGLIIPPVILFAYSELNPMGNRKIELIRKHEISFYKRNKDKIWLAIITGVIVFVKSYARLIWGYFT